MTWSLLALENAYLLWAKDADLALEVDAYVHPRLLLSRAMRTWVSAAVMARADRLADAADAAAVRKCTANCRMRCTQGQPRTNS